MGGAFTYTDMGAQLTKIEAVNQCLSASGQMPVNQIDTNTTPEARLIVNILDTVQREVLAEGWDWNTEYEVVLEASQVSGKVAVPPRYLRFNPIDKPWQLVRGGFVWDRKDQTYEIDESVRGTVVLYFDWDELPHEARNYVTKRTARRYYEQHIGSSDSLRSLYQDEMDARRLLLDVDLDVGDYSIFDAPDMQVGISRGNEYSGTTAHYGNNPFSNRTPGT